MMTYEPHPTGGAANGRPAAQRTPQPASVRNAVEVRWTGAGLVAPLFLWHKDTSAYISARLP
jgi:hypothetical protein